MSIPDELRWMRQHEHLPLDEIMRELHSKWTPTQVRSLFHAYICGYKP